MSDEQRGDVHVGEHGHKVALQLVMKVRIEPSQWFV
jgi:hypothetical protein